MGFEPMNTGFADQRVSHFAIGASLLPRSTTLKRCHPSAKREDLLFFSYNFKIKTHPAHRGGWVFEGIERRF